MADLVAACTAFIHSPRYFDATPHQLALLGIVCDQSGPHKVKDLARAMGVAKPVITRATTKLVDMGFVRRDRSDADKRDVFISPTDGGRALREELAHG
ncbi:MAG TPA: MarR family transcriptional regulator [Sphingobium sp.]|uniref:MarR family transcriptional regulator n=1 Tax=Sphingobium sp. TaxID=1912891 RepID=UPI002ED2DCAF